jgi:hypothetical protein
MLQAITETGRRSSVEAIGVGVLVSGLRKGEDDASIKNERGRERLLGLLESPDEVRCEIRVDGRDLGRAPVLFEALNCPRIGPELRLAEAPRPPGAGFEALWLLRDDLDAFRDWLTRDDGSPAPLRRARVSQVLLTGASQIRVDDQLFDCGGGEVVIRDDPPAFRLLVPQTKDT